MKWFSTNRKYLCLTAVIFFAMGFPALFAFFIDGAVSALVTFCVTALFALGVWVAFVRRLVKRSSEGTSTRRAMMIGAVAFFLGVAILVLGFIFLPVDSTPFAVVGVTIVVLFTVAILWKMVSPTIEHEINHMIQG